MRSSQTARRHTDEFGALTEILVGGDIILTVVGYEISGDSADFDKIHARLSALRPGDKLIVKVLRGGKVVELSAEVDKK